MRKFPDFDDNLRQAFRRETELLFENIMRGDRSILEFLNAKYTYVNETGWPGTTGFLTSTGRVSARWSLPMKGETRRITAARQYPDRHFLRDTHVAGDSR